MKVIIAGSRDIANPDLVYDAINASGFEITEVFCGMARGVDMIGRNWALSRRTPVRPFAADWKKHGKAAGPIRNEQMAKEADALIAVSNGSPGTADMIHRALSRGLKVCVKYTCATTNASLLLHSSGGQR